MASEKNLNAVFTDIANAIREKKGTTAKIKPINMATEITNLTGGSGKTIELSVTQNGTYIPDEGATYSKVSVNVSQTIENLTTTELSIIQNGVYVPDEGAAYSKVSVNVPQAVESGTLKALLDATKSCFHLFNNYKGTSVNELISYSDTSNVTTMNYMFNNCPSLTTIPQLDTSKVNNMKGMFYNCTKLVTIPQLDASNVRDMSDMFYCCYRLKSILMTGMKVSFNIFKSTDFQESDLVTILNNLATVTSTQTLTMGSTNLAKLTDEEKAIATNKGWTLK